MLVRLLGILLRAAFRVTTSVAWFLLGIIISALLRFGPLLFYSLVSTTSWSLSVIDQHLNGRISRNRGITILLSGALWAFVSVLLTSSMVALFGEDQVVISSPVLLTGLIVGLLCGMKVQRNPGWISPTTNDHLQLGETVGKGFHSHKYSGASLSKSQRTTTLWTIGQPGAGKSRALASWAMADITAGRGLGFLDPHEDTFDYILKHTSILAQADSNLAERIVIVNPLDERWAIGFNPLQLFESIPPERIAAFFSDVAMKIWKIDASQAPRMSWLMAHTFLALAELGLTLVELPLFLRDSEWRNRVVERLDNIEVRDYFLKEYPSNERLRQEWMQSTINKMGQFVMDPAIKLILGQRKSTVDFREIMDNQRILLVNLSKGRLGIENSQLFGAFIVGQIQQAALSRADTKERPEFYLYLDEFQNYTTDHIQEILSESRKYNLSLVISHQYLAQLPADQKQAVMNTYGTLICFRIGYQDAEEVVRELFMPDLIPVRRTSWNLNMFGRLPVWLPLKELGAIGDEWERFNRELTNLKHREFWVKVRGSSQPIKQRTLEMPEPKLRNEALEALVTLSGVRYARRKEEVKHELLVDRPKLLRQMARGYFPNNHPTNQGGTNIWGS